MNQIFHMRVPDEGVVGAWVEGSGTLEVSTTDGVEGTDLQMVSTIFILILTRKVFARFSRNPSAQKCPELQFRWIIRWDLGSVNLKQDIRNLVPQVYGSMTTLP